jgi:hypothetical protein
MEVNYLGPYMVAQAFVPFLIKEAARKKGGDRPSLIMVRRRPRGTLPHPPWGRSANV